MDKKLIENWDKAIWENIIKIDGKMLNEVEKKLKVKFPMADKKYIKAYNNARSVNIVFRIEREEFKVDFSNFNIDFLEMNTKFFLSLIETYFPSQKIVYILSGREKVNTKIEETVLIYYKQYEICYDFTKNEEEAEFCLIIYEEVVEKDGIEILKKEIVEGTVKKEKLENVHSLKDLFEYMYITDEKVEKEEVFYIFRETATENEIKKFEEELGIKFPENYENMLNRAREEGVRLYPKKWKVKVPRGVMEYDTGMYIDLKDVKETYEIFLEEHKPYPKKLIPIALYGNGDYACLDYRGKLNTTLKEPKITYYVHDEIGNRRFIHLADSYDKFLDMIEIDEEEIERREKEIEESYFYGEQPLED